MKTISAEILSTGNEVLLGAVADTNAAHIASELWGLSVPVSRHTCVGDDLAALVAAMREIAERADVAVVTGGLGPTPDDLTSIAAATAAGVPQVLDPDALAWIEALFQMAGRPMPPSNRQQALFPEGSLRLDNPIGTAPGFALTIGRCRFFFLPGVPREMRRMMADKVLPALREMAGGAPAVGLRALSIFGATEASIGEKTADIAALVPGVTIGLQASFPVIRVKVYGRGETPEAVDGMMDRATALVEERLGQWVLSREGKNPEDVVGNILKSLGKTLAVAESCTGGLISHMLTQAPGSSDYFLLGAVTYSNEAKTRVLSVSPETIARFGAVSTETAAEMAEGARRVAGADFGLSTSGIAGPTGGSAEKPVGTVCIGFASGEGSTAHRFHFPFYDRERNKGVFAAAALDVLRRSMTGLPIPLFGGRSR